MCETTEKILLVLITPDKSVSIGVKWLVRIRNLEAEAVLPQIFQCANNSSQVQATWSL